MVQNLIIKHAIILAVAASLALAGCATAPQLAGTETPPSALVLEEALSGRTQGYATIKTLFGDETRFTVSIDGRWDGTVLTLVEDFFYENGKTERKTWQLTKIESGRYSGTREDVIGVADVRQDGNAVRLDYEVMLDTSIGRLHTRFRDILFLESDGVIRNRATISKWGVGIAGVDIILKKTPLLNLP